VAAVAALNSSRKDKAWLLGAAWGAGHMTTILAAGAVIILLRLSLPERLLEAFVGLLLIALGLRALLRRGHSHPPAAGLFGSALMGLAHGLAGSAAVALAALAIIPSPAWAMAYLLVFSAGTMAGMIVCSLLIGKAAERLPRFASPASGLASLAVGAKVLWNNLS
jgi:putative Ca2+/H+ antiporter (TMEM165/GDT1 family)